MTRAAVIIAVLFSFFTEAFFAQAVIRNPGDLRDLPIHFNPDTIRGRQIKSIHSNLSYKPDGQVIEDKGLCEQYDFDTLGRVWRYYRTRIKSWGEKTIVHPAVYRKGRRISEEWTESHFEYTYDTMFTFIHYDSLQRVKVRRNCDGDYYSTWYYQYNPDGTMAMQSQCRETNLSGSPHDFRLGMQTIISMEEFRYQKLSATQIKQICLNDEGKSYKEVIMDYDASSRLLSSRQSFIVSWVRISEELNYDDKGRLTAHRYRTNAGTPQETRDEYIYDSIGNMYMVRQYKDDKIAHEAVYLYDPKYPALYAITNRRFIDNAFDIIKFSCSFYEKPGPVKPKEKP